MYKIGDMILMVGYSSWCSEAKADIGKRGKVVGFEGIEAKVFIESSKHNSPYSTVHGVEYTWTIAGNRGIELLDKQLLFEFMYD